MNSPNSSLYDETTINPASYKDFGGYKRWRISSNWGIKDFKGYYQNEFDH